MKINRNVHVGLSYTLRSKSHEGEVVEATQKDHPLEFIYGAGLMLPKFEEALLGMEVGEEFKIEIPHLEGYGPVFEDRIVDLPKTIFVKDGEFDSEMVAEGNVLPMMDNNGGRMDGKVLKIEDEIVKMDFNHPMAGEDLFFTGVVLSAREASDEELAQIAQAQEGGCSSCGGGDCGSGDCSCEDEGCGSH